jgi:hypothetical protein
MVVETWMNEGFVDAIVGLQGKNSEASTSGDQRTHEKQQAAEL